MTGHVLLVDPESELVFTLSHNEATPRCMMTLRHGGGTDEFIAFKVRKTATTRLGTEFYAFAKQCYALATIFL
jgi:hypothetical protein